MRIDAQSRLEKRGRTVTQNNRVVVRYLDGRVLKGVTFDFLPNKGRFHVAHAKDAKKVSAISTSDLKAIFFVRSFEGRGEREHGKVPEQFAAAPGRKLRITFLDGEVVHGSTHAYTPGREGFFIVPADPEDNNERAYVFTHATKEIRLVPSDPPKVRAPSNR